ncbi:hypothetical protein [Filimonas lacunae]|uniref:hypothetical protein n=1 Tax=Filimonas lacunae TaxID=477680 RepID=UPI0011E4CDAA|nr:hypothetical protein [Filimonas lacunae]
MQQNPIFIIPLLSHGITQALSHAGNSHPANSARAFPYPRQVSCTTYTAGNHLHQQQQFWLSLPR